jgi:hypothetical protein
MPHKGNEQAGVKAPAFRIPVGFSHETMPIFGGAFSHAKHCFVEFSEDGVEFAAFLPTDRAFDMLAAAERMLAAKKDVPIDSAEIWPMCRSVTQGNLNRLWKQVRRLREYEHQKIWAITFARYGYEGGFER